MNSASLKPLEELTFFLDRQFGRHKMEDILRAAGLNVIVHDDLYLGQRRTYSNRQNSENSCFIDGDKALRAFKKFSFTIESVTRAAPTSAYFP